MPAEWTRHGDPSHERHGACGKDGSLNDGRRVLVSWPPGRRCLTRATVGSGTSTASETSVSVHSGPSDRSSAVSRTRTWATLRAEAVSLDVVFYTSRCWVSLSEMRYILSMEGSRGSMFRACLSSRQRNSSMTDHSARHTPALSRCGQARSLNVGSPLSSPQVIAK